MAHIDLPEGVPRDPLRARLPPRDRRPLLQLAEALFQADNTLSHGERELIAAYVSRLNRCYFCEASDNIFAALQLDPAAYGEMGRRVVARGYLAPVTPA